MYLFPIGELQVGVSYGTYGTDINSSGLFEPNGDGYCNSRTIYHSLVNTFVDQIVASREAASPHLVLTYYYTNLFDYQYGLMERFAYDMSGRANSFYIISWDRASAATAFVEVSSTSWKVTVPNARYYGVASSKVKACNMLLYNAPYFKVGTVSAVSGNDVTIDVTSNYGSLAFSDLNTKITLAYPIYQVYFVNDDIFQSFEVSAVDSQLILHDGGALRSGNIAFVSKYPI